MGLALHTDENVRRVPLRDRDEIDLTSSHRAAAILQQHLFHDVRSVTHIAQRTKLSAQTVSKLLYGVTKEPRFTTILALMKFYGFKVNAVRVH